MHILHVVSSLNVGGAERFVIDLAAEQNANAGYDIGILSMGNYGEPLESELEKHNLRLHRETDIKAIKKLLSNVDVVHVHSSYCLLRVLLASMFMSIKVIYTRHNERVHYALKWRFIYFLANFKLHKMIFVAEKARMNFLEKYPSFKLKSETILNGVLPMPLTKNESTYFRLSHVGRFVPLKAQHYLIEAVARIPENIQQHVALAFFGTGELMDNNINLAKETIPNVKIGFRGFVTDRDDIYQHSDALIVTSETEGLSLAILEALASGTPVIASNVGGTPELVEHDYNGLLYEYSNSKQLAEQIVRLYNDKELYKLFSERSVEKFKLGFSMKQCAQNYNLTYQ